MLSNLFRLLQIRKAYQKQSLPPLPFSLTLGLTYRCNLFCETCNVTRQKVPEMSLGEWAKIFSSFGGTVPWITVTGGEIFLYRQLRSFLVLLLKQLKPKALILPTNGTYPQKVADIAREMTDRFPKTTFIFNLSLDGGPELHNAIRHTKSGYQQIEQTLGRLKRVPTNNLVLGIGTVISKRNVRQIDELIESVRHLQPDSFVFEPAQNRQELFNQDYVITPLPREYAQAAHNLLSAITPDKKAPFIAKLIRNLRSFYHPLAVQILKQKRQVIPCLAGVASCHISCSGQVWECCTDATSLGYLPAVHYDFPTLWWGARAKAVRAKVKSGSCACPLGNISYLNMLFAPLRTFRIKHAFPLERELL